MFYSVINKLIIMHVSNNKPAVFERCGNMIAYRYDITETAVTPQPINFDSLPQMQADTYRTLGMLWHLPDNTPCLSDTPYTTYSYNEVKVHMPLSANDITEAVISKHYPVDREQKLLNDYNAAQLGVYTGEKADNYRLAYERFLAERQRIKDQIDADYYAYVEQCKQMAKGSA